MLIVVLYDYGDLISYYHWVFGFFIYQNNEMKKNQPSK